MSKIVETSIIKVEGLVTRCPGQFLLKLEIIWIVLMQWPRIVQFIRVEIGRVSLLVCRIEAAVLLEGVAMSLIRGLLSYRMSVVRGSIWTESRFRQSDS